MIKLSEKKIWYKKFKYSAIKNKDSIILKYCTGKNVLDIGCVGQDWSYQSEDWLHNKIKNVSKKIVGVDINNEGIKKLSEQGYSIFHMDELKNLNEKFDIILMADVIEHVNNPVEFLSFYSTFLETNGQILITTPNATRLRTFMEIITTTTYSMNQEHTFWFCPKTILEVISRANLNVKEFYWLKEYIPKIKYLFISPFLKIWKYFNPNFLIICTK